MEPLVSFLLKVEYFRVLIGLRNLGDVVFVGYCVLTLPNVDLSLNDLQALSVLGNEVAHLISGLS